MSTLLRDKLEIKRELVMSGLERRGEGERWDGKMLEIYLPSVPNGASFDFFCVEIKSVNITLAGRFLLCHSCIGRTSRKSCQDELTWRLRESG